MKKIVLSLSIIPCFLSAQNSYFNTINSSKLKSLEELRQIKPSKYSATQVDYQSLEGFLSQLKDQGDNHTQEEIISLPSPDGKIARFKIWKSSVMEAPLQEKYPEIQTFTGQGIDDKYATIKLDMTPLGFHAMVWSAVTGTYLINPYTPNSKENYISYFKNDLEATEIFSCNTPSEAKGPSKDVVFNRSTGSEIRSFRIAYACTGEYARAATGLAAPTVAQTLAKIVTSNNRINGVYEQEFASRLILVANNDLIVFVDPATDPFNGNGNGGVLIGESQTVITQKIGSANYDIGHTFSTGGGGLAGLGVVCISSQKASGITGRNNPVGDGYDIDYVAHEIGHQFGCNHTFNADTGSCNTNGVDTTNAEPGSGITIMAYAGICGYINNVALNSIANFHPVSYLEATNNITNSFNCKITTSVNNIAPVANAGADYTIPLSTPFKLTGSATDADNDPLTYSWEQNDVGAAFSDWNLPVGNAPIFTPLSPVTTPVRYLPKLANVISNTVTIGEIKPSYARTMKFVLTARDNKAGCGGLANDEMNINVVNNGGAFTVTSHTTNVLEHRGSNMNVTWNVSGTTNAPINCANVSILLSTDGGLTFPHVLSTSTPNDGSQAVLIPVATPLSTTARVMVVSNGNIFYNVNSTNFTILETLQTSETSNTNNGIRIFPNPSSGDLNIKIDNINSDVEISLVDMSGKLVFASKDKTTTASFDKQYKLGHLSSGTYLVTIKNNSKTTIVKWIKK